jgi:hypothetical protein
MDMLRHGGTGRALGAAAAFALGIGTVLGLSACVSAGAQPSSLARLGLTEPAPTPAAPLVQTGAQDFVAPLRQNASWEGAGAFFRVPGMTLADMLEAKLINHLTPAVGAPLPVDPFRLPARSGAERERAVRCLATAIYFEAALESERGQRAVAQVILNRVRDPNFPKSVCGVVYQGWERSTGCQFSFTCDGSLLRGVVPAYYRRAEQYARDALSGYVVEEVGTATHYHADYVAPYWGPSLSKIGQIGAHIFYRWPGAPGMPSNFTGRYRGGELAFSEAVLTGRAARPKPEGLPGSDLDAAAGGITNAVLVLPPEVFRNPGRVRGILLPGGRRKPTPEDIAAINKSLARFDQPAPPPLTAAPPAASAPTPIVPAAAPAAKAEAAVGEAMPVVEINRPAAGE